MAKKMVLVIEIEFSEDVSEDLYDDRAEWVRSRIGDCARILEIHDRPWYPEGRGLQSFCNLCMRDSINCFCENPA